MTKDDVHSNLQWHPAFFQAMQAELFEYRDFLEFRHEYSLTAAPLQIDLLVIKKPKGLVIDKNIAHIFKSDNVMEYKSPEDYLSVKDFWKVCAYANFYAANTPGVDLADLTVTFVESRHPRKLLRYLTKVRGYTVDTSSPGIYQVTGDYIPIQVIESRKLPENENLWLESLRNGLKGSRLNVILQEGEKKLLQGINIDAYLDVVLRANQKTFKEGYKMWKQTLAEIMEEEGLNAPWIERGQEKTARNMLDMGMPIEDIVRASELPVERIRALADLSLENLAV